MSDVEKYKKITEYIMKYIFDSEIQNNVTKLYNDSRDLAKTRTISLTYQFNKFGTSRAEFIVDKPKQQYIDMVKNLNIMVDGVNIYQFLRLIPDEVYWKNTAYVRCFTSESYQQVRNAISEVTRYKSELNTSVVSVITGLKTNTMMYILKPESKEKDINKMLSRNSSKLFTDEEINEINHLGNLKYILPRIPRFYFMVLSEGLFNKGNLLKKMFNMGKNLLGAGSQNYSKKFIDRNNRIQ